MAGCGVQIGADQLSRGDTRKERRILAPASDLSLPVALAGIAPRAGNV